MGVEIERKFIVNSPDWRQGSYYYGNPMHIRQGYLANGVRVRLVDYRLAYLTIKGPKVGISCEEYEYEIPYYDGIGIIQLCQHTIHKYRHPILYFNTRWQVDEFLGDNYGLVVAEVELSSEDAEFSKPAWIGEETNLSNYDLAIKAWRYR